MIEDFKKTAEPVVTRGRVYTFCDYFFKSFSQSTATLVQDIPTRDGNSLLTEDDACPVSEHEESTV